MSTITSTYGLAQGSQVKARLKAKNFLGLSSAYSSVSSTNALAEVVPLKPVTAPIRGAVSSQTQIVINWGALAAP